MGMKNMGSVFQSNMVNMLGKLQPRCTILYIDSIFFSLFFVQQLIDLKIVFKRLHDMNTKSILKKFALKIRN